MDGDVRYIYDGIYIMDDEYIHICIYMMEYYTDVEENEISLCNDWLELENIKLSEISQRKAYAV